LKRREFIKGAAAAAASAVLAGGGSALAMGEKSAFAAASLKYDGRWNLRPSALRRLMFEVGRRTAIAAAFEPGEASLMSPALFDFPFLHWSGDSAFPQFSEADVMRLRRYAGAGGTVLVDGSQETGGEFIRDVGRELSRAFPSQPAADLPEDHTVYKSFYMLRGAPGRLQRGDRLTAVVMDGRAAVIISPNDMGGAWARDSLGNWEFMVEGGDARRELAFRMGINIVMYAMCVDYKDDHVHIPFILKRRKR
jgi:hypothetical protein